MSLTSISNVASTVVAANSTTTAKRIRQLPANQPAHSMKLPLYMKSLQAVLTQRRLLTALQQKKDKHS